MMDDPAVLTELGLDFATAPLNETIVIRLPGADVARINNLEAQLRGQGHRVTRSAILRSFILQGLATAEADHGLTPTAPTADPRPQSGDGGATQ